MTACLLTQFQGDTALLEASGAGHVKMVALLIEHGAVVNYCNKVRLLYVHGPHGVAQNGVLSSE